MEQNNPQKKRVTIKEIAKETGFTAQTVSLALRKKDCITEKTKNIVLEAARRLGYIKNDMAINLRRGHTNTIAVIYDDISNPYFSLMTKFLQKYFREKGYVLLIFTAESYFLDEETFYNVLSCNVAGVVSFLDVDEKIANLSEQNNLPVIVLGRKSCQNISWITTAENKGGALAARYLMEQGCKNNLHITYSLDMICGKERYEGFLDEIKNANENQDLLLVLWYEPLRDLLPKYLKEHEVDGIFAFNDMLAYETLNILKKENRQDIKVVGFDNIQELFNFPVKISTIGSNKKEMAKTTVKVLIEKIEKKDVGLEHHIFDVFLSAEGNE